MLKNSPIFRFEDKPSGAEKMEINFIFISIFSSPEILGNFKSTACQNQECLQMIVIYSFPFMAYDGLVIN